MKKFIVFFILLFPLLCNGQGRVAKQDSKNTSSAEVKQVSAPRAPAVYGSQKQVNQTTSNIVYTPRQNQTSKEVIYQNQPANNTAHNKEVNKPQVQNTQNNLLSRPDLPQKPISLNQAQKEVKPVQLSTTKKPVRPGNYQVVYWNNFIYTPAPREQEWATKILDTSNISLDGSGVQVAILDSGIKAHPQFNGSNIEIIDITGQNNPFDFCGHGTAVAGIIAGQKGEDFKGIAPGVNLKSYKIADESGTTNNTYIINALESVLEYNRQNPQNKISIINISYGLKEDNYELKNKLAEVYSSGITIISAAGNDGTQGLLYPAAYDFVFAAGSINKDRTISDFSNWGLGLDFVLPGYALKTLGLNQNYVWVKGTSFSSAYLTGVCALITQAFKNKYKRLPSPQEVYEVLQKISRPLALTPSIKQGYGVPDASKIVSYI